MSAEHQGPAQEATLLLPQTIDAVAAWHAAHRPQHPAITCEDRVLTYAQLHARSNRIGHALLAAGAGPGARVVYLGQESEHYYTLLFGCAKAGAVLTPVNWRLATPEVAHILRDCGAVLVVAEPQFVPVVRQAGAGLAAMPSVVTVAADERGGELAEWAAAMPRTDLPARAGQDDPVVQMYTSGTTGLPKGVVLAHRSFFRVRQVLAEAGLDWIDFRAEDVSLVGVPGFHIGGLWWALQGLTAGVTNVCLRMFRGDDAVAMISRHGVTVGCVVPAMLQLMLDEGAEDGSEFSTLRKIVYGGSPIGERLLEQCMAQMGCEFAQIYGLTESGNTAVCLPPAEHVVGGPRMTAAGRAYPGFGVQIRDEHGVVQPAGTVGEVWLRTPSHMIEYWGQPAATAETLVDGWLRTGDAGYLDDEDFLFICDRIKDTIIVAGENVYPAEVENVLTRHESVVEAAVVGIPDDHWGEAVHAFVVLTPGATVSARELLLFQQSVLAHFKIPSSYEYLDKLPRNASGKILRRELREKFWQGAARRVN